MLESLKTKPTFLHLLQIAMTSTIREFTSLLSSNFTTASTLLLSSSFTYNNEIVSVFSNTYQALITSDGHRSMSAFSQKNRSLTIVGNAPQFYFRWNHL